MHGPRPASQQFLRCARGVGAQYGRARARAAARAAAAHATPRFILLSCQSSDRARDSAQSSYYWLRFNTTNEIVFSGPQCTEDST
jgi:hypothetical protein